MSRTLSNLSISFKRLKLLLIKSIIFYHQFDSQQSKYVEQETKQDRRKKYPQMPLAASISKPILRVE